VRTLALAGLLGAAVLPGAAPEAQVVGAEYAAPTDRYPHAVLGDALEWGALVMRLADGQRVRVVLPEARVFEDVAPRLADIDGDGDGEVITVESDRSLGARLAVYDETGLFAATPFIGARFRWLAPIGAADLDDDGRVEIAYIDRPHLAKVLRIWRYDGGRLREVASAAGFTNHRIGEARISGGIRSCGGTPEIVVADADWRRIVGIRLADGIETRDLGPYRDDPGITAMLDCP
jgi:hypothetical protein